MSATEDQIKSALSQVIDPHIEKDLISSRSVKHIQVQGDEVSVEIELGYPANSLVDLIRSKVTEALQAIEGVEKVHLNIASKIVPHAVQRGVKLLPSVKNIIAVASGKGGVGKSTTAVNLALALHAEGARVGILDADIYGPSIPLMMNITDRPKSLDGKTIEPLENYGIQVASIGFMIEQGEPMVWRGPMVTQALMQLLTETNWRELDYLVIDMPPGTGDVQLTLSQKIPVTGAVIVTTPQDIALLDARKGLKMFEKVGIPILGVVENMSMHVCSQCGHQETIFGVGGGEKMCAEYGVDLLAQLPLQLSIREQMDVGQPPLIAEPNGAVAAIYKEMARKVAIKVATKAKDMTSKFPTITVQNT